MSLHRGAQRTDKGILQGLGEGALAPERGWGTPAGTIWHVNKGSPFWEDWAFSLAEGGQGGVM